MTAVVFRRVPLWRRALEKLFPSLGRARQARLRDNIRWLCEHPDVPVIYE